MFCTRPACHSVSANELKKFEAHKRALGVKGSALMDTAKADILYGLVKEYWSCNPDSAIVIQNNANLSQKKLGT